MFIRCIQKGNSAGRLIADICDNANDLPGPLPWVSPALNNLWLEACRSHLVGNYQASIITTSILLELTLRMIVTDRENLPVMRDDYDKMFEKDSLSSVIGNAKRQGILNGTSKKWWELFRDNIRNKICHGDLLHILDDCRSIPEFEGYFDPIELRSGQGSYSYLYVQTDPAAIHHKAGRWFSHGFLNDAERELLALIGKTKWPEYDEWWESQKDTYVAFFEYDWSYRSVLNGMESIIRPFGRTARSVGNEGKTF